MKPAISSHLLWLVSIFLLSSIVLVPLTIRIKIDNWRKNKNISLEVGFLFFAGHRTFALSRFTLTREKVAAWSFSLRETSYLQTGLSFFSRQLKILNWRYLALKIKIGNGDPAHSALLAGSLLGASGLLSRYLQTHYFFKRRPRFSIYPSLATKVFYFDLSLAFKTSVGRLLYLGICLMAYLLAGRWLKNAGTSHPGLNENSHGKLKRNGGC